MKMIKRIFLSAFITTVLPVAAYASDISVHNNTNTGITASVKSTCSSTAGSNGVLHAHSSVKIKQSLIDSLCLFKTCSVNVYASDNCSGSKIATVKVNWRKGVKKISNTHVNGFYLSGSRHSVSINGRAAT